jgi:hypothetical protein
MGDESHDPFCTLVMEKLGGLCDCYGCIRNIIDQDADYQSREVSAK